MIFTVSSQRLFPCDNHLFMHDLILRWRSCRRFHGYSIRLVVQEKKRGSSTIFNDILIRLHIEEDL
jgi:hypothetical protein